MSKFEFVGVLLGMVLSLAIGHVLTGVGQIVQRGIRTFSIPLAGWMIYLLFLCIDVWFSMWSIRDQPTYSLGYVAVLRFMGSLLYVSCWLVVPHGQGDGPLDLVAFYAASRRKALSGIILYFVTAELVNVTLPGFDSWGLAALMAGLIVAAAAAWYWAAPWLQLVAISVIYVLAGIYAVTYIPSL